MRLKKLSGRNFLTLLDFSASEIKLLLRLSTKLKKKKHARKEGCLLRGKTIALLFEKDSTRTRCAFEVAAFDEGANVTYLTNTHFGRKESIHDTAKVLGRYYDGIQFRGFSHDTAVDLANNAGVPVWNGLTDKYHPTQALADLLTIKEQVKKPFQQVDLVYVGDASNNVAASLMIACAKMGVHFTALAPDTLFPDTKLIEQVREIAKSSGSSLAFTSNVAAAVKGADVIYTDTWLSMGSSDSFAERIALLSPYQVNQQMLDATGQPNVIFMHCLPACHDTQSELGTKLQDEHGMSAMEVTDEVFQSRHSVVFDQAENRLHTIKAVMVATMGGYV